MSENPVPSQRSNRSELDAEPPGPGAPGAVHAEEPAEGPQEAAGETDGATGQRSDDAGGQVARTG